MLHEEGVRVRTMSLFYEQWLGKLPIGELERVSLLFDIGELHAAGYARVKRSPRRRARARRARRAGRRHAVRASSATFSPTAVRSCSASRGRGATACRSRC